MVKDLGQIPSTPLRRPPSHWLGEHEGAIPAPSFSSSGPFRSEAGKGSRPIIWSIAGNDSGGGAGLTADLRAADAFGVHLCPVVAALTAQNSRAVERVEPIAPSVLEDQLAALEHD